jgi:very-short-patch-repair endonuclease
MDADRSINRLARRQHGLVTRQQARAAGASPRQIDHKLGSGQWVAMRRGVYAIGGAPPTWEQAVLAACLATAPSHASHHTAGRLWGLTHTPASPSIHLVRAPGRFARLGGVTCHRSDHLPAADLTVRHRVPVTSRARTIVELSGGLTVRKAGRMVDDAMHGRPRELEAVRACTARLLVPGRRRLSVIRAVLAMRLDGYEPTDSDLEVRALHTLRAAGIRPPVQQHRVRLAGRRCRIDLAYPDQMLAIELDGWAYHRSRSAFDDDRARGTELVIAGWRVVRFTSSTTDEELVDAVRRLLATGAPAA